MLEPALPELAGKAQRVVGMFVAMIGSGIILESSAFWTGTIVMFAGIAMFLWGFAISRPVPSGASPEQGSDIIPPAPPVERNL